MYDEIILFFFCRDLSGNHFNGTLPEALCTKSSLNLRFVEYPLKVSYPRTDPSIINTESQFIRT